MKRNPNIIFILVDDLGWTELGCDGHPINETPNIDDLADKGIKFTQAYASSTVCSPSRAGILTGQSPPRNGITDYLRPYTDWFLPLNTGQNDFSDNELPEDTSYKMQRDFCTMGEMFKTCGYSTGIIGKWHLSGYNKNGVKHGPDKYGFDEVIISEQTGIAGGSYFHPYTRVDPSIEPVLGENEYLVDRMNYEAVEFIKKHKNEPFFLYLSHYAVHTTLDAKETDIEYFAEKRKRFYQEKGRKEEKKGQNKRSLLQILMKILSYLNPVNWKNLKKQTLKHKKVNNPVLAAMLKSIDDGVGMIVDILTELNLSEDTIIIFTSDNGGDPWVTKNGVLRGGKSFTYEGGLRVPQIIYWPECNHDVSIIREPTINLDFYPTFAEIIGYSIPKNHIIDGLSILPLLKGEANVSRNSKRVFSWHYPLKRPHFLGGRSSAANRRGQYKYIWFFDDGTDELYNLETDLRESKDLSSDLGDIVREHREILKDWINEVDGQVPKNLLSNC